MTLDKNVSWFMVLRRRDVSLPHRMAKQPDTAPLMSFKFASTTISMVKMPISKELRVHFHFLHSHHNLKHPFHPEMGFNNQYYKMLTSKFLRPRPHQSRRLQRRLEHTIVTKFPLPYPTQLLSNVSGRSTPVRNRRTRLFLRVLAYTST